MADEKPSSVFRVPSVGQDVLPNFKEIELPGQASPTVAIAGTIVTGTVGLLGGIATIATGGLMAPFALAATAATAAATVGGTQNTAYTDTKIFSTAVEARKEVAVRSIDSWKETELAKLKYRHEAQMREFDNIEKEMLKLRCSECPASFENTKELTAHVRDAHPKVIEKLRCNTDSCNSIFETLEKLEEHKKNIHGGWSKMDDCPYPDCAGICFKNRDAYLKHLSSVHRCS